MLEVRIDEIVEAWQKILTLAEDAQMQKQQSELQRQMNEPHLDKQLDLQTQWSYPIGLGTSTNPRIKQIITQFSTLPHPHQQEIEDAISIL